VVLLNGLRFRSFTLARADRPVDYLGRIPASLEQRGHRALDLRRRARL